jgi:serpin B
MISKSNHPTFIQVAICLSIFFCNAAIAKDKASDEELLVKSNWAFSMDLYSKLTSSKENVFFSPYSISTALAMTYAGSRELTEKQMAKVLHFNLKQKNLHAAFNQTRNRMIDIQKKGHVELSIANALWLQQDYSFKQSYLDLIANNYGGGLNTLNLRETPGESVNKINKLV